jgi:hypothetical protein
MAVRTAFAGVALLASSALLHSADLVGDAKEGSKTSVESLAAPTDFEAVRVFTDAQGQAVSGRVQDVTAGGVITIARQGGGTINAKLTALSLDDQKYVESWYSTKILSRGRNLTFKSERVQGPAEEKSLATLVKVTEVPVHYEITIKSTATLPLTDLTVISRTYKRADQSERGSSLDRVYEEAKEQVAKIDPGKEVVVKTAKQTLTSSKLDGDFEYISGAKRKTEDRVGGVWLRVYKGDILVGEFADPKSLKELESWDAEEKPK